jgi:malate/lactate dehydrogenase
LLGDGRPLTDEQKISGHVAAKGDFAGKEPATEEAKKAALTGVDIAIIPAGVPRESNPYETCCVAADSPL